MRPKEDLRELLFRDEEAERLARLVKQGMWTVVLGPRMVGKTSLIKATLKGSRSVYVNLWGARNLSDLLERLSRSLQDPLSRRIFSRVDSLTLGPLPSVTLRNRSRVIGDILGELSRTGRVVVILDEVQELSSVTKQLWDILSYVFYSFPNVTFVFTGSMTGLIRVVLSPPEGSPLVGRKPVRLELKPFTEPQSREFLRRGFEESGMKVPEVDEVVGELDGIPGWLTLYGYLRVHQGLDHERAMEETRMEACKVLKESFSHFLRGRRNRDMYLEIVKRLPSRWSELKRAVGASDEVLREALRSLQDWFYVKKINEVYEVHDRMMRFCALNDLI
ncbi:hypothetical protein L3N51_02314 [Metallosphaera sp. J1]|uniref:AAA family ATPase n=1 Tax=Metallosphaera javensis (ex Hofmann et al. 2022) TaxID=99938 RepID=UPI001EDF42A9|nr:ATP-binding protein [Metallosphaera javensis (ex Hofmann et al. 2022)]MCG3110017.1 hypothetical protein [Metallosphaera javensis (ex Hofmann et al. 2022)]